MIMEDGLLPLFPVMQNKLFLIPSILIFGFLPFILGFKTGRNIKDKQLIKSIFALLLCMISAFILVEILKGACPRVRYRALLKDGSETLYLPWFKRLDRDTLAVIRSSFSKNDLRSFPSGHGVSCIVCVSMFPLAAEIFPSFKGRERLLFFLGVIFSLIICLARILLGAHYLSDLSLSAMLGAAACLIFCRFFYCSDDKKG